MKELSILKQWRSRSQMEVRQVEEIVGWPSGTLAKYESDSLRKVPCDRFYRLVTLYRVRADDLFEMTWSMDPAT